MSRSVRTLHGDPLGKGAESMGTHAAVGVFAGQVHSRFERGVARCGEGDAGAEKAVEALAGAGAAARGSEFDVAGLGSTFRAGSVQAYGEGVEGIAGVDQQGLAGLLFQESSKLIGEIQTLGDGVGELSASGDGCVTLVLFQGGEMSRLGRIIAGRRRWLWRERHEGSQVVRPVAEFLIQAHMLGAIGKREQGGATEALLVNDLDGGVEQKLGHAAVPVLGEDGEGAEEAKDPQRVIWLLPMRRPLSRAARVLTWGACQREISRFRSPMNSAGLGMPINVPNATRKMRSASFSSDSFSGPTVMLFAAFIRSDLLGHGEAPKTGAARRAYFSRTEGAAWLGAQWTRVRPVAGGPPQSAHSSTALLSAVSFMVRCSSRESNRMT